MTTPIILRLNQDVLSALDDASKTKECTRTKIMRNAISYYLNFYETYEKPTLEKMKASGTSFYDQILKGN
jgi:metal-responsive CopG/Arc/MetJ family transcriptional regulator